MESEGGSILKWPSEIGSVSRETLDRLQSYEAMLQRWNRRINLVGRNDNSDFWTRHILDCAQLVMHVDHAEKWIDLGAGAGLPGLVCAIVSNELSPKTRFTLVESDQRKSIFLTQAAAHLGINIDVKRDRIEAIDPEAFDVISARALAPVSNLFNYAERLSHSQTIMLFLKGRHVSQELTEASENWHSLVETHPSLSDPSGKILKITKLQRRI